MIVNVICISKCCKLMCIHSNVNNKKKNQCSISNTSLAINLAGISCKWKKPRILPVEINIALRCTTRVTMEQQMGRGVVETCRYLAGNTQWLCNE